ncbi:F-box/FBD/LRR-repeat protein At1g13570 [Solanum lycopersicum]|uniref:F-box/FBD/LRR-repeat protein At1g13570 n=1 Tax=Solanum lycopersicum TaxID=4081 RepID=UPI00374A5919
MEMWSGKAADYSNLKSFGCTTYYHISKDIHQSIAQDRPRRVGVRPTTRYGFEDMVGYALQVAEELEGNFATYSDFVYYGNGVYGLDRGCKRRDLAERAGSYWRISLYNMRYKCRKLCFHRTVLSDLPRNILDEILMCLPFQDVVRTSILSKKWRNIWHGLPVLTLSHTIWKPEEDLPDLTNNLVKIINHILIFHTGPLVLQISGASSNVIEISAPNLRSFDYTGNIRSVCLKNIPRLARLSLSHREYYVGVGKCNIAKFFESFSALEHLHLNDMFFVAGAGEVPTRLSYDLYCVKHLCISSVYLSDSNEVSCALCLIKSFPNLQSLEIKVEGDDNDIPALNSLEVERFSDMTFNHLRKVKLLQTNGTIPEIQLIKLLLAKSPELMKVIIEPCLVDEAATVKMLTELIQFQRASTKARVVYKSDKHPNPGPV